MSWIEGATNCLWRFNMFATMARQGDCVQLKQSDIRLAWNMAKMAKAGFPHTAMVENQ
jgi:hypothetical protein